LLAGAIDTLPRALAEHMSAGGIAKMLAQIGQHRVDHFW
jgi:hypothetical protein